MCVFVIQINKMRDEVAIAIFTDNRNGCKDHSYTRAIRLNDIKLPTTNNKNDNRNAYHTIKLNADLLSLFFFLFTRIVAALDVVKEAKYTINGAAPINTCSTLSSTFSSWNFHSLS